MQIDRCICFGVTFKHLKDRAGALGATTVSALQADTEFGTNCGLCKPYVREMLGTGEIEFDRIITENEDA